MGIQLGNLVKGKEINLESLNRKTIAVDAFLFLYQFLSIIRGYDGTPLRTSKGKISSHISGLFYRSAKLLEAGITLVYVFDGPKPEFKYVTHERRIAREEAEERWKEALAAGKMEEARTAAQQAARLTDEMIMDSKKLLEYMGIPVVQAISEGEAQCAHMCKQDLVYSVASQDADSLLFGAPRLIRNLSITGKRKIPRKQAYIEIKPELIELKQMLKELKINQDQLIIIGMLIGTDFNHGIKGIGPKTALKIVKEEKTLDKIIEKIDWNSQFINKKIIPAEQIFDFFKKPPVKDINPKEIEPGKLQPEKILKFMVDEFEFSHERIGKVIKTLTENKEKQTGLGKWLK